MDPKTFTVGALLGAALWEIFKQSLSALAKRNQESQEAKRKMLREDIEYVIGLVCELLETSVSYYATDFNTEKASDLSRQIKAKSKTVGMKLTAVNIQLSESKKETIEIRLWTAFKSTTAKHLDVTRTEIWKDDDSRLAEIYKAAHHMHSSLNKARYSNT